MANGRTAPGSVRPGLADPEQPGPRRAFTLPAITLPSAVMVGRALGRRVTTAAAVGTGLTRGAGRRVDDNAGLTVLA